MPPPICKVEGCESPAKGRGWCNRHYLRWWNYGDPCAPILKPGIKAGARPWQKGGTPTYTCQQCGVRFVAPGRGTQPPKYCSQRCHGATRRGANNHNWRGGVGDEHDRIRHSQEYRSWRRAVRARDNDTCQECGQVGGKLHVDHIKPFSTHPELRMDLDNGRTLCIPCHEATPTFGMNALKAGR